MSRNVTPHVRDRISSDVTPYDSDRTSSESSFDDTVTSLLATSPSPGYREPHLVHVSHRPIFVHEEEQNQPTFVRQSLIDGERFRMTEYDKDREREGPGARLSLDSDDVGGDNVDDSAVGGGEQTNVLSPESVTSDAAFTTVAVITDEPAFTWRVVGYSECSVTCTSESAYNAVRVFKFANYVHVWVTGLWSQCSRTCGDGEQYRSLRCWRMLAPGFDSTVHAELCGEERPRTVRACSLAKCGPLWETTTWSQCSVPCGHGEQTRDARCSTTGDESCDPDTRPVSRRICSDGDCVSHWTVTEWSTCRRACELRRRSVSCRDTDGKTQPPQQCDQDSMPLSVSICGNHANCPAMWVPQKWSQCSAQCGEGVIRQQIICGGLVAGVLKEFPADACKHLPPKPENVRSCTVRPCDPRWYSTQWSECSTSCGPGVSVREVRCYESNRPSSGCPPDQKPDVTRECSLADCPDIGVECKDDPNAKCALVEQVNLCEHWYYKKACCRTCTR
ncbi:PREDICTED: ADAMTS-like protein 2 [Priapulus caudatus]|uniref:ADAMTS-like protein 2 n=1 Tax=Priapulus caudatus TaxID=37621 RepID=A0ABM1EH49_PRICU|nr:PREDICTED: ADAMTS-like protein 2 [Priapulus caudatus]